MCRARWILWIRIHFHFCWGATSLMPPKTARAALSTKSRCLRRSGKVEVGVVTPKSRPVSVLRPAEGVEAGLGAGCGGVGAGGGGGVWTGAPAPGDGGAPRFVCLSSCISIPLHGARRAMAATCRCPSRQTTYFSSRSTHFRPPRALIGGMVGVSQHLLLPRSAEKHYLDKGKNKGKGKIRASVWSPPPLLLRPFGSGLDLHLNLRVHLLSHLLLGGRGLVVGYLRSLSSLLPAWAGGGPPPPR